MMLLLMMMMAVAPPQGSLWVQLGVWLESPTGFMHPNNIETPEAGVHGESRVPTLVLEVIVGREPSSPQLSTLNPGIQLIILNFRPLPRLSQLHQSALPAAWIFWYGCFPEVVSGRVG